jgi:hypothetical protein
MQLITKPELVRAISHDDISPTMIPELRFTDEWSSPRGRTVGDRWRNNTFGMRYLALTAGLQLKQFVEVI